MTHYLKLHVNFYDAVVEKQTKNFEVRNNDRGFQKGDLVKFTKTCPKTDYPTRYSKPFEITYVLSGWGIEPGHVVFGIKPALEREQSND